MKGQIQSRNRAETGTETGQPWQRQERDSAETGTETGQRGKTRTVQNEKETAQRYHI